VYKKLIYVGYISIFYLEDVGKGVKLGLTTLIRVISLINMDGKNWEWVNERSRLIK